LITTELNNPSNDMDIKPAKEKDIIDILYLLKKDREIYGQDSSFRLPMPDYTFLKNELEAGNLFILKQHSISVGTFSLKEEKSPGDYSIDTPGKTLWVERMAFASYWITAETVQSLLTFLEKEAQKEGYSRIRFHIHRKNEKMNAFYQRMNIPLVEEMHEASAELSYHEYEKTL